MKTSWLNRSKWLVIVCLVSMLVLPLPAQADTLTEFTFTGQIDKTTMHSYKFTTTNGGVVQVQNLLGTTNTSYQIVNSDTYEEFTSGENLPGGTYSFVVSGESDAPVNYSYKISGIDLSNVSNQLPQFQLTNPANVDTILPKSSTSINVTGTHQAQEMVLSNDSFKQQLSGTFNVPLSLEQGTTDLNFNAVDANGNAVTKNYHVTIPTKKRLGGADRYEVSSNVYNEIPNYIDSGTIVVAYGGDYSDAISGTTLAYSEGAPLLLTTYSALPESAVSLIQQLQPTKAIILGGTSAVSTSVETQLSNLGVTTIQRIGGADRYETSALIAANLPTVTNGVDTAIVATGQNFADALAASGVAANKGMPILLTTTNSLPASIESYINSHPEIKNFIIVGGTASVSDSVKTRLQQLRPNGTVTRIGGANRFEVAINLTKHFNLSPESLVFCSGLFFPDGLSAAPLAGYTMAPLILSRTDSVDPAVNAYLSENHGKIKRMYFIGGTSTLYQSVEDAIWAHVD